MTGSLPVLSSDIHTSDFCPGACGTGEVFDLEFTMAFQPIVSLSGRSVWAHEALVRGPNGEGAGSVLGRVNDGNRYRFDQACRVKAIELAAELGTDSLISINFLPNAVYEPRACLRVTLAAAKRYRFPIRKLMFEIAESERAVDLAHLSHIVQAYANLGLTTALDDFGAGWSGLNLLAAVRPQVVKLDMALCQGAAENDVQRSIVKSVTSLATDLGIQVVAEGVEVEEDLRALRDLGIDLFQGYLFARPALEALPEVSFG